MRELDVRGEICPYPMMRTVELLRQINGEDLMVITDHPPALTTIPWEAAKLGYEADLQRVEGRAEWRILLRKTDRQRSQQEIMAELAQKVRAAQAGGGA